MLGGGACLRWCEVGRPQTCKHKSVVVQGHLGGSTACRVQACKHKSTAETERQIRMFFFDSRVFGLLVFVVQKQHFGFLLYRIGFLNMRLLMNFLVQKPISGFCHPLGCYIIKRAVTQKPERHVRGEDQQHCTGAPCANGRNLNSSSLPESLENNKPIWAPKPARFQCTPLKSKHLLETV